MLTIRKAEDRGHANHGWLNSHHTFSFADYRDGRFMGFGPLRVINDDTVEGGGGFPPHSHRDMEIISYVIDGALEHRDNMGNGSIIKPGDVQRMSAGPGVVHAEFNASKVDPVHFLQIWIIPERQGLPAGYEQKFFGDEEKRGKLRPGGVARRRGRIGAGATGRAPVCHPARRGPVAQPYHRRSTQGWLHVVTGTAEVNGNPLSAGDGVAIDGEEKLVLRSNDAGELLLFDMAL